MRLAFVVADPRAQDPSYATVYMARAALQRGHEVVFVGVNDLTLLPDNRVGALVLRAGGAGTSHAAFCSALAESTDAGDEILGQFDVVFLRYNPHRETGLGAPVGEFGWRLGLGGVLVVNDAEGAQRAGGRMYLSGLPAAIRPRILITRDPAQVKDFLRALDGPALIKPLAGRGTAAGRFYVARGQVKNLNQMISVVRKSGYLVVQEYLPDAAQAEKRLLLLGGEPLRSGKKVAIYRRFAEDVLEGGADGSIAGGRGRAELGPAEQKIVDLLRPRLEEDGLYFVGIEIVGDKVLEVNVHTPGGAGPCAELYDLDIGEVIVRDLERRVEVRRAYRKSIEQVA